MTKSDNDEVDVADPNKKRMGKRQVMDKKMIRNVK